MVGSAAATATVTVASGLAGRHQITSAAEISLDKVDIDVAVLLEELLQARFDIGSHAV